MSGRQRFPGRAPNKGQQKTENRRVPAVDFRWQGCPAKAIVKKMVGMFTGQLDGIPEKRVVLHHAGPGNQDNKKGQQFQERTQTVFWPKGRVFLMQSCTDQA